jgi:hypothetical protein
MYMHDVIIVVPTDSQENVNILNALNLNAKDYSCEYSSKGDFVNYSFQTVWAPEIECNSSHDFIEALANSDEYLFVKIGQDINDIEVHGNSDLVNSKITVTVDWNE